MYLNVYVPQLQNIKGTLKFIRIHRGHKVTSTLMVEPITRRFVSSIEQFAQDNMLSFLKRDQGNLAGHFSLYYVRRSEIRTHQGTLPMAELTLTGS